MNAAELKDKSLGDLQVELRRLQEEQCQLKLKFMIGQLKQTHLLRAAKKSIARVKTLCAARRGD